MAHPSHVASLTIALLAVSVSAILIKLCVSPPTTIAFWRLLMAGLVFVAWSAFTGAPRLSRRDFGIAFVAALFLAAHFYLWIASLFMTSINSSVVLLATQPLFALVLQAVFEKLPPTRRNILSLVGGLAGAAILAHGDFLKGGLAGKGDLYSIAGTAMVAVYLLLGTRRRGPLVPYLGAVYTMSGLMLAAVAALSGDLLLAARPIDWLWLALLAAVPTLLGHTLLNRAMQHFPSYAVNFSILVEPLLTSVLAFFVFAEIPTGNVVLGAILIIGAVVVEVMGERRTPKTANEELRIGD
ncbi:MAG: DMT family transporter [Thermoanaerobaculia bacterium]|nr:DMT family transporter [Thermoanaerobaculia bacterium]